ncbi:hypothetical protein B0O99DRAFT_193808 [Bisporella sp. PMI_857]|nr:hypothetical protein B0O99DRAFT_193808 [Bisporella sp. PMI_857]
MITLLPCIMFLPSMNAKSRPPNKMPAASPTPPFQCKYPAPGFGGESICHSSPSVRKVMRNVCAVNENCFGWIHV